MSMSLIECPICMDAIESEKNRVVTDCGHAFHCSCLMQNAAHNGFGCPYCRSAMANEPQEEDEEDEEDSIFSQVGPNLTDNALTSFRMFQQQIEGEEPEEEPQDDDDDWETDDEEEAEEPSPVPDAAYMAAKLQERGITYEDLVKKILVQEHSSWDRYYMDYDRRSGEVFGQFRAIISRYRPVQDVPAIAPPAPIATPIAAEPLYTGEGACVFEPLPIGFSLHSLHSLHSLYPHTEIAEPKTTRGISRR